MEEATASSRDLRQLVLKALENDEKLARRFDDIQSQTASVPRTGHSSLITADDNETIRQRLTHTRGEDPGSVIEASDFRFAFDQDLQATRVYRRLTYMVSEISLPSSPGRSRGSSFL